MGDEFEKIEEAATRMAEGRLDEGDRVLHFGCQPVGDFLDHRVLQLLPHKRGPRSGHKLTHELMQFVAQLRVAEPGISSPQLAERIVQRFGISVHPRSIDRQLRHQKKLQ